MADPVTPSYPNNPPAQNTAGTGYLHTPAPTNYFEGLQQSASSPGPVSSQPSASASLPSSGGGAPIPTPSPAAVSPATAPTVNDAATYRAISAGQVAWGNLPPPMQETLTRVLGPTEAPHIYEAARLGTAQSIASGAQPGSARPGGRPTPAPAAKPGFFDDPAGGGFATDLSRGIKTLFGGGTASAATAPASTLPEPPSGGGVNVAKSVAPWDLPPGSPGYRPSPFPNSPAAGPNIAAAGAANNPDFGFTTGDPNAPVSSVIMSPHVDTRPSPIASPPPSLLQPGYGAPPVGSDVPEPPTPPYGPLGAGEGTSPKTVTVGPGDTLSSIAEKALGDPARAWQIARANGMSNANRLQPGQTLILPASAADTPNPRPRPGGPPGQRAEGGSSYYDGLSPFTGGADAQASSGQSRDLAAMPSRGTETAPGIDPEGQAQWDAEDRAYDRSTMGKGMQPNTPGLGLYPDQYYNPNYGPVERMNPNNRYMEDIVPGFKESTAQAIAALSANDNGPKGQSMIPGSRLPLPLAPNMMQDYFRNLKPLPVSKPANQAQVSGGDLLGGEREDMLSDPRKLWNLDPATGQYRWQTLNEIDQGIRKSQPGSRIDPKAYREEYDKGYYDPRYPGQTVPMSQNRVGSNIGIG